MSFQITGENGFLFNELKPHLESYNGKDGIFLLGSPTFDHDLTKENSRELHRYVQETLQLINENKNKYIIFASSTSVDDINFSHSGSMSYALCKLFIENYIVNHCEDYLILRIGNIVSSDINTIRKMKETRIQQRILKKKYKNIPISDEYLNIETFIKETVEAINDHKTGIFEYTLTKMKITTLIKMTNEK